MIVIKITTKGTTQQQFQRNMKKFPQMTRKGMRAWGSTILVPSMTRAAKNAGIKRFTGDLFRGIRWQQKENSNTGELMMPPQGVFLDKMLVHRLWFRRHFGTRLRWADQAQKDRWRYLAREVKKSRLDSFFIWVHPHPFIKSGYLSARRKLPAILKTYLVTKKEPMTV